MLLKTTSLLCFFLLLSFLSAAQTEEEKTPKRIAEYIQEAESALLRFDHKEAEALYLIALEKKKDYAPALRGLAIAYDLQEKYKESAELLEKIVKKNDRFSRVIYFDIAVAHYRYGNYNASIDYFKQFDDLRKIPVIEYGFNGEKEMKIERKYRLKLKDNIRACHIAKDSIFNKNVASVENIGAPLNTSGNEYFPFMSNDQNLLYFTRQLTRKADENLFYSQRLDSLWSPGIYIDSIFNTPVNEGMATFTRDERQMFFTACQRRNVGGTCDIRKAYVNREIIDTIAILNGQVNSEKWESQACISCDGSALFFSSNRPGGFGNTDLYVSYLQADGTWASPQNLGPKVNTKLDEESPFITNDGKTLFFSSTGHLGLGEQDLFMSRLDEHGEWGEAINLGPPINTAYRELGFFLSADGLTGLFSSNRPGGIGQMDVYQFLLSSELSSEAITYVEGYVKDSITLAPVQTVLYPKNHRPVPTEADGRFFLCLKADEDFDFKINEKEYLPYHRNTPIPRWDNKTFYPVEVLLQPFQETAVLIKPDTLFEMIYFDFDRFGLTDSSQIQLSHLIKKIKGSNIERIEILGYCDYYGTDQYNMMLSNKRAQTVSDFFKQQNILRVDDPKVSVSILGKGEINNQADRALNRRVEIKIIFK